MTKRKRLTEKALREYRSKAKAEVVRSAQRKERLSAPISAERIMLFLEKLIAVPVGGEECWLYVGCRPGTTLSFKATGYANLKFNGETVGPHQFALAASDGITLADLDGWDVHHASDLGRCIGYRCVNPCHLERRRPVLHRGTRGEAGTLHPRHNRLFRQIVEVAPRERKPAEYRTITGAGSRQRVFAGLPFLIKLGDVVSVEGPDVVEATGH